MQSIAQLLILFIGLLAGLAIAIVLQSKDKARAQSEFSKAKKENLKKVLGILKSHHRLTNNDVEHLLGVSPATAWRYLEELEKEGFIQQVGRTGRQVYYKKS